MNDSKQQTVLEFIANKIKRILYLQKMAEEKSDITRQIVQDARLQDVTEIRDALIEEKKITTWNFNMEEAPRDNTPLQLLVKRKEIDFKDGLENNNPSRTVGFNNYDNSNDDTWFFPGRSVNELFMELGAGEPIAWAFMLDIPDNLKVDNQPIPLIPVNYINIRFTTDSYDDVKGPRCFHILNSKSDPVRLILDGRIMAVLGLNSSYTFHPVFIAKLVTKDIPDGVSISTITNGIIGRYSNDSKSE